MSTLMILTKRNIKLFFKDKGMFFTALITPLILLVLYATFLGNVYRNAFATGLPQGIEIPEKVLDALVGGQLVSSILAVSCVTVSFCANFLMVQDKANDSIKDLTISPVNSVTLSISYYLATLASSFLICFVSMVGCLGYLAVIGWYLSLADVLFMALDVVLLVFFGTALSSIINFFLSTQGQISAVGSIISSCYGFICGAYMPISNFPDGLQKAVMFLPGTYGTSLMRNHAMGAALDEMGKTVHAPIIEVHREMVDCKIKFFDKVVDIPTMYAILAVSVIILVAVYILMNVVRLKKSK